MRAGGGACRPFTLHRSEQQLQQGRGSDMSMQPGAMLAYIQEHFAVLPGAPLLIDSYQRILTMHSGSAQLDEEPDDTEP